MLIPANIKAQMITAFKVALLWQDEDFSELSIDQCSEQLQCYVANLVDSFIAILSDTQKDQLIDDPDNFGQWLCLEQMGHGSGFYDSTDPTVSSISKLLDMAQLFRPSELHLYDDTIHCDFFKYGSA